MDVRLGPEHRVLFLGARWYRYGQEVVFYEAEVWAEPRDNVGEGDSTKERLVGTLM